MNPESAENPYLLLTPGPLSTSPTVRRAMLRDWCTWDDDYNLGIVTPIRQQLVQLATATRPDDYTAVLMQGSGSFSVESTIGSVIPEDGKLLVLANGAYGDRLAKIAAYLKINHLVHDSGELSPPDLGLLETTLHQDNDITHVVVVHNETTTGMMNPLAEIARIVKAQSKNFDCRFDVGFWWGSARHCRARHRLHRLFGQQMHPRCTRIRLHHRSHQRSSRDSGLCPFTVAGSV